MRTRSAPRTLASASAILSLLLSPSVLFAVTDVTSTASLRGTVMIPAPTDESGATSRPAAGAIVAAADVTSGAIFESAAAGEDGDYSIKDLPSGTYALAVRTDDGVYYSDDLVSLANGDAGRVSFSLREGRSAGRADEGPKTALELKDEQEKEKEMKEKDKSKKRRTGNFFQRHPGWGGAIIAGSAVSVGYLVSELNDEKKQKEEKASP